MQNKPDQSQFARPPNFAALLSLAEVRVCVLTWGGAGDIILVFLLNKEVFIGDST